MGISNTNEKTVFKGKISAFDLPVAVILCLIIGIIPLVTRLAIVPVGSDELEFTRAIDTFEDLFAYYKSLIFVYTVWALLGYSIVRFFISTAKIDHVAVAKSPYFYASAVFLIFTAISTATSSYQHTVYNGISERYESFQVLIGYFVVFFTTIGFANNKFKSDIILFAVSFSAFLIGLIGFFQFINMDPFTTDFGARLISGGIATFTPVFNKVYSTLLNPNCVGLYCAMAIPFLLCYAIFYKGNKLINCFLFLICGLLFISFIGAASSGGLVAAVFVILVAAAVLIIYCIKNNTSAFKYFAYAACALIALTAIFAVPSVRSNAASMIDGIFSIGSNQSPYFYRNLSFDSGIAVIDTTSGKVSLKYDRDGKKILVVGNDGEVIPAVTSYQDEEGSTYYLYNIDGFGQVEVSYEAGMISFRHGPTFFFFVVDNDGNILPLTKKGKVLLYEKVIPSFGFEGMEFFASSRGYIWSRSIPLLRYFILTGSGPDTFSLVFPQDDVLGKVKFMGDPYIIVDKAHSFYLQTFINTGGISLAALLVLFGFYLVTSFSSLVNYKSADMTLFGMRLGAFLGVLGYLVAAASTDSTVAVSPVFWAILGLGIALNRRASADA